MRVIGHRGAMAREPENTLRSFVHAESVGVDELELDLRVTADGHVVVLHDATLDRTTSGRGAVADHTLEEVRRLDAGAGEQVPLFEEVLDATSVPLQTELKVSDALAPVLDLVRRRRLQQRVYLTSTSEVLLRQVRATEPAITVGLIVTRAGADTAARARAAAATIVCPRLDGLTPAVVESLAAARLQILPWIVDTPEDFDVVAGYGVDGFATNDPDLTVPWNGGRTTHDQAPPSVVLTDRARP